LFGICNTFAKQIRIPSELQVHRVLEEHVWEDIDWQMPNKFPPEDVGEGVVNKNPPYFYEGKS